jgi:hypothetical protein
MAFRVAGESLCTLLPIAADDNRRDSDLSRPLPTPRTIPAHDFLINIAKNLRPFAAQGLRCLDARPRRPASPPATAKPSRPIRSANVLACRFVAFALDEALNGLAIPTEPAHLPRQREQIFMQLAPITG